MRKLKLKILISTLRHLLSVALLLSVEGKKRIYCHTVLDCYLDMKWIMIVNGPHYPLHCAFSRRNHSINESGSVKHFSVERQSCLVSTQSSRRHEHIMLIVLHYVYYRNALKETISTMNLTEEISIITKNLFFKAKLSLTVL